MLPGLSRLSSLITIGKYSFDAWREHMDMMAAITNFVGGVHAHVIQPVARKAGQFREWIVQIFVKAKPTDGLRSENKTDCQPPTPLHTRSESTHLPVNLPEVRELSEDQLSRLKEYEVNGPGGYRRQDARKQAVARIVEAVGKGSREISFAGLEDLEDLPDGVLQELTFITKIDCSGCRSLRPMPACFTKLPFLRELNLSGNGVRGWSTPAGELKPLERLILDDCSLEEYPDFIKKCPALTHLSLQYNKFVEVPTIPSHIEYLNLDNNKIVYLPLSLSEKRKHPCFVMMDFNPITQETLREQVKRTKRVTLLDGRQQTITTKPNVYISHTGRIRLNRAERLSSEDLIRHWFQIGDRTLPSGLLEKFKYDETVRILLKELAESADYLSRERYEILAWRVCSLLEILHKDEEVFQECYDVIRDATASCADRASRGLSEIEFAVSVAKAKRQGTKALAELGEVHYRKTLVDEQALKRLRQIRGSKDDIETLLLFEIYFAKNLKLAIDAEQLMRFRRLARTEQEHLDQAEAEIAKALKERTQEDQVNFLAQWEPWKQHLATNTSFQEKIDVVNENYGMQLYNLPFDVTDTENPPSKEQFDQYYAIMERQEIEIRELYMEETKRVLSGQ